MNTQIQSLDSQLVAFNYGSEQFLKREANYYFLFLCAVRQRLQQRDGGMSGINLTPRLQITVFLGPVCLQCVFTFFLGGKCSNGCFRWPLSQMWTSTQFIRHEKNQQTRRMFLLYFAPDSQRRRHFLFYSIFLSRSLSLLEAGPLIKMQIRLIPSGSTENCQRFTSGRH